MVDARTWSVAVRRIQGLFEEPLETFHHAIGFEVIGCGGESLDPSCGE